MTVTKHKAQCLFCGAAPGEPHDPYCTSLSLERMRLHPYQREFVEQLQARRPDPIDSLADLLARHPYISAFAMVCGGLALALAMVGFALALRVLALMSGAH